MVLPESKMYQFTNSSLAPSARNTYLNSAPVMQHLQQTCETSRRSPGSSPLHGPAHKLPAMNRSTIQDIEGFVSYRYGAMDKDTNEMKEPTGKKIVFHLRPDEVEDDEVEVEVAREMEVDLASLINDDEETASAAAVIQCLMLIYNDDFEGEVELDDNAEDEQAQVFLGEADLASYICAIVGSDEDETQSGQLAASVDDQELPHQQEHISELNKWDNNFEFDDNTSVQEAIVTPPTRPIAHITTIAQRLRRRL
jgi:hypothetical protein